MAIQKHLEEHGGLDPQMELLPRRYGAYTVHFVPEWYYDLQNGCQECRNKAISKATKLLTERFPGIRVSVGIVDKVTGPEYRRLLEIHAFQCSLTPRLDGSRAYTVTFEDGEFDEIS